MILRTAIVLLATLAPSAAADPLREIDATFHGAYAAARAAKVARQGPVLVVSGDRLLLYRDETLAAEAVIRPPAYHRLKELSHVPLAIRLTAERDGALDAARAARLAALRERVAAAGEGPLLAGSLRFLDGVLARNAVQGLEAYCASMGGAMDAAAGEAAGLELAALGRTVAAWRKDLLGGEWAQVRVVVIGSHMAREGEVAWQYFSRLLGEGREGGRLVFAEEKWEPREALKLLATHAVDADLGRAFFGDPGRMHRDVLAPGAKIWLDSNPPPR